jgi:hypothetical protein
MIMNLCSQERQQPPINWNICADYWGITFELPNV